MFEIALNLCWRLLEGMSINDTMVKHYNAIRTNPQEKATTKANLWCLQG